MIKVNAGRLGPMGEIMNPYSYFVHGLVLQLRPKTVLEMGLGVKAYTALNILDAFQSYKEDNPHYYVVELHDGHAINRVASIEEYQGHFTCINGNATHKKFFKDIPNNLDLICIDANHTTAQVLQNINIGLEKSKKETIFVFHDSTFPSLKKAFSESQDRLNIFCLDRINIAIGTVR